MYAFAADTYFIFRTLGIAAAVIAFDADAIDADFSVVACGIACIAIYAELSDLHLILVACRFWHAFTVIRADFTALTFCAGIEWLTFTVHAFIITVTFRIAGFGGVSAGAGIIDASLIRITRRIAFASIISNAVVVYTDLIIVTVIAWFLIHTGIIDQNLIFITINACLTFMINTDFIAETCRIAISISIVGVSDHSSGRSVLTPEQTYAYTRSKKCSSLHSTS